MKLHARQLTDGEIWLRDDSSDDALFAELVRKDEYGYIAFKQEPKIIIDAGANIGLSARLFAKRYPEATIIAMEAELDNYKLLQCNTNGHPRIIPLHAALMSTDGYGHIVDVGEGDLAYQVSLSSGEGPSVKCISFKTLKQMYNLDTIDLLKMDIEGAEYELFRNNQIDFNQVGTLIIELHDHIRPGCNKCFFEAIKNHYDFEWIGGENYYFSNYEIAVPVIPEIFKKADPQNLPIEDLRELQHHMDMETTRIYRALDKVYLRVDELEGLYKRVDEVEGLYKRTDELEGLYKRVDEVEGLYGRVDNLERLFNRVEKIEGLYERIDRLEGLYKRVDKVEGLYKRVDSLEGLYKRVDEVEGLYQRVDKLEKLHTRVDNLESLCKQLDKLKELHEHIKTLEDNYYSKYINELNTVHDRIDNIYEFLDGMTIWSLLKKKKNEGH